MSDVHEYSELTDKCACGATKPGHKHVLAAAGNANDATETCRCGATIAHSFVIKDASEHKCNHVNGDINCAAVASHTWNTAGRFCTVCGAVNFAGDTELIKVGTDCNNYKNTEMSKYTAAYTVRLMKAYEAVAAYDYATSTADTLVAKTTDEQTAFNALVKTFNDTLADKVNFKSGCSATINFIDDSSSMIDPLTTNVINGKIGEKLTLKVVPKAGYKFVGWYSDSAAKNLLSTEPSMVVTASEGNTDYYAKLSKNDTVDIEIPEGIKYKGTITNPNTEKEGVGAQVGFVLNEKVTVSYEPTGINESFLYFEDNNGNSYTASEKNGVYSYEFTVSGSITKITAKTTKLHDNDVFVAFMGSSDPNSKVLRTRSVVKTNGYVNLYTEAPTVSGRIGMDFVGWATAEDQDTIVKIKQVSVAGNTLTLVPVFKAQSGFNVTIKNGSFVNLNDAQKEGNFTYGDKVGITAPEKDAKTGKYFSGWYVNGTFYDATRTTYYTVKGNDTIVAMYDNDEPAEEISYLTLAAATSTDTGVRIVNLAAKWKLLSDEYSSVIDSGYIFSFTGKTADDLKLDKVDGSSVRKKVVGDTSMTASMNYPLSLKSDATKNATVTAVAYLTVRDANGIVRTIYSDMVTAKP